MEGPSRKQANRGEGGKIVHVSLASFFRVLQAPDIQPSFNPLGDRQILP